jgi:hypothetical protein
MPQTTSPRRFRFAVAITCFSLLAAALGVACAQQNKQKVVAGTWNITVTCTSHTVTVLATGPDKDPMFVCPGDTVKWVADSTIGTKRFSVRFETSPFADGARYCEQTDCPGLAAPTNLTKIVETHKYVLIVDKQVFDPHVIIVPGNITTK